MKRTARHSKGSVVYDRRRKTWNLYFYENGVRHSRLIGTRSQYPTKSAACRAADAIASPPHVSPMVVPTIGALVELYRREKMPKRFSTRRSYESRLKNHVIPRWGECVITELQARPAELWLESLDLTPRGKGAVRMLLRIIWDFGMWSGAVPTQRNPIELVSIQGSSKRTKKPHCLTVEEFQRFVQHLAEPFHTIALVSVCFGLRISEALALRWADVDWLAGKLTVERGIIRQHVGDVKTEMSHSAIAISKIMLEALKLWKQTTQFSAPEDWIFASPSKLGRLPWSADAVNDAYKKAALAAGIPHVSSHSMRHTYRSWLDAVGTPTAVQQKLMRHADIRTTMNTYGDVVTNEMAEAQAKVAELAVNSTQTARTPS